MTRDMSKKQYRSALRRHGFRPSDLIGLGYYQLPDGTNVSVLNVGFNATRRAKLAFLLKEQAFFAEQAEKRAALTPAGVKP